MYLFILDILKNIRRSKRFFGALFKFARLLECTLYVYSIAAVLFNLELWNFGLSFFMWFCGRAFALHVKGPKVDPWYFHCFLLAIEVHIFFLQKVLITSMFFIKTAQMYGVVLHVVLLDTFCTFFLIFNFQFILRSHNLFFLYSLTRQS